MPTTQSPGMKDTPVAPSLYMALELSGKQWKLAFSNGSCMRPRRRTIEAWYARLLVPAEVAAAKARLGLPEDARVKSVYEAALDGFWVHRMLEDRGYENVVIDPASLQVDRRKRRPKTDRIDVDKMLAELIRHHRGERVWRSVRVPSIKDEDARRPHRERGQLQKEALRLGNRMRGLLATQGVRVSSWTKLPEQLDTLRCWNGEPLPAQLAHEIERMCERLDLVREQLKGVENQMKAELDQEQDRASRQAQMLQQLRAISGRSALVLTRELFAWRQIANRRQLGALVGLVGTPYDSGGSIREQGISKAGNRRIRTLMVELAWLWLRYQPQSGLSRWYQERFAKGNRRTRRIGIVALARKLLVAFWRFIEHGVVPEGAELRAVA